MKKTPKWVRIIAIIVSLISLYNFIEMAISGEKFIAGDFIFPAIAAGYLLLELFSNGRKDNQDDSIS